MIETLIIVLIILIAFGVVFWAVATYAPVPQPWSGLIIIVLALIAMLLILRQVGVVSL